MNPKKTISQKEVIDELLEALSSLLNPDLEKYSQTTGCPMCDSGVLRDTCKKHWDNCNWNNARLVYERVVNNLSQFSQQDTEQVKSIDFADLLQWLKDRDAQYENGWCLLGGKYPKENYTGKEVVALYITSQKTTKKLHTVAPPSNLRTSGSLPKLPIKITLFTPAM